MNLGHLWRQGRLRQETQGDAVASDLEPRGVFSHELLQRTQAIVTPGRAGHGQG